MKQTTFFWWNIMITTALAVTFAAHEVWAQSVSLESLFIGGGYDDDVRPGEKVAPTEAKEREMPEEVVTGAERGLEPTPLVEGVDVTEQAITGDFFERSERQEPLTNPKMYESAGYISRSLDATGEVIDGEQSNQNSFSTTEVVYIDQGEADGVTIGSKFLVLHAATPDVIHPNTGDNMGFKVLVDGVIEVVDANMDISKALIIRSYDGIERGENIRPYEEDAMIPTFDPDRPVADKEIEGVLVASKDPKQGYAAGDVVYFDVGDSGGVEPGDVFNIIDARDVIRKDGRVIEGLPKIIGSAKVLTTREETCTALITYSRNVMYAGDRVSYSKTR